MSLSSTTNRVAYSGNGSTTVFSFPYLFFANADLKVVTRVTATGVETVKTLDLDYTVTGAENPSGGSVTFGSAPASGTTVTIYRDPSPVQDFDADVNDLGNGEEMELRLDKYMAIAQRMDDRADRSLRLTEGYTATFNPELPAVLTADTVLKINADGDGFELGPTVDEITNAQAYATAAAASAAAAADSQAAAATSEANAATSEENAATSEANAAASALSVANAVPSVTGTRASPQNISAASGIAFSGTKWFNTWFIQGNGGAVTVTANPRIAVGTATGQKLRLIGRSDTNTLSLDDGNGLDLNGSWVGSASRVLDLEWDGTNWLETGRR